MARLIYSAITSLDGYVADPSGDFGWAAPDDEVHAFVNDLERPIGTCLYGRRLYEVMTYWETASTADPTGSVEDDFARIWQAADKVVYSTTLDAVSTERTTLEREFDADAVRARKESSPRDLSIGGPHLAAHALRAGLVDEIQLYLSQTIVGGGTAALPDGLRLDLELVDTHRFSSGVVYLRYLTR